MQIKKLLNINIEPNVSNHQQTKFIYRKNVKITIKYSRIHVILGEISIDFDYKFTYIQATKIYDTKMSVKTLSHYKH